MENVTTILNKLTEVDIDNDLHKDGKVISDQDLFIIKGIFNAILTQAFCVFGSLTNVINMVVFYRMGFSKTINITLMALSLSDFGACFTMIWRNIALNPWFQQLENLPFETNEISYLVSLLPHNMFVNATKQLTAFISVERCLCVTLPLKVKSIITKKVVKIYCVSCFIISAVPFVPLYLTHRYQWKFSPLRNRTLYGMVFTKNVIEVNDIVYPILNVVFSQLPFFIIVISAIFLVLSLRKNLKWRQTTTTSESQTSNKENKISKMIIAICFIFIACFLPYALCLIILNIFPGLSLGGKYSNAFIMMGALVYFFECVNSSCNIFIYYENSSVYKATFDKTFRCWKNSSAK